jgi:hypothetical protein
MKNSFLTILALLIFSSLQAQNVHNLVVGTSPLNAKVKVFMYTILIQIMTLVIKTQQIML